MNAMIRALKGTLALLALAGLGWLLRWMTAGSISGLRTYDLDSLTVLAVGTIAWIAYIWLALAVRWPCVIVAFISGPLPPPGSGPGL